MSENKILPDYEERVCKICGQPFMARCSDTIICSSCEKKAASAAIAKKWREKHGGRERNPRMKPEKAESEKRTPRHCPPSKTYNDRAVKPTRKCHDCGKPIFNYRCAECWKKKTGGKFYEADNDDEYGVLL